MKRGSNKTRGCVKSPGLKFGNDPIFDMARFDELSRWIGWSKNEFSHRLAPEPTAVGAVSSILRGFRHKKGWTGQLICIRPSPVNGDIQQFRYILTS